ncbi:MAG TPA: hypothetical protein VHE53_02975 [Patescibacteria group bacterium]|nr:hypothetical protein [Patescibacteria group bacterium]
MNKRFAKKVVVSGKHTHSELAANASYKNYHHRIKRFISTVNPFNKIKK